MKIGTKLLLCLFCMKFRLTYGDELSINLFRNPSIGVEYRIKYVSTHVGYYPTIISKNAQGNNQTTGFFRTGLSIWPSDWMYASVSHLYGIDGSWKNRSELLLELGLQARAFRQTVGFRLGLAVMPSSKFGTKVNPTPGVSIFIPL